MSLLGSLPEDVARECIWRQVYDSCIKDIPTVAQKILIRKNEQYTNELIKIKQECVEKLHKQCKTPWGWIRSYCWVLDEWENELKKNDNQRWHRYVQVSKYAYQCDELLDELLDDSDDETDDETDDESDDAWDKYCKLISVSKRAQSLMNKE